MITLQKTGFYIKGTPKKQNYSKLILCLAPAFCLISLFILTDIISPITSQYLFLNLTASAPIGIYVKSSGELQKGDYIILDLPKNIKDQITDRPWYNGEYLLKKIGAEEGESFEIRHDTFFVQDKYFGQIYKKDSNNKALPQLKEGRYIIQKDYILPVSPYSKSFDGRYYGAVSKINIITKVKPFLVKGR